MSIPDSVAVIRTVVGSLAQRSLDFSTESDELIDIARLNIEPKLLSIQRCIDGSAKR
jgi:hypothetical protein